MGPGRHPNCQTVHVYAQTPGGFAVEFGWGHRRLNGPSGGSFEGLILGVAGADTSLKSSTFAPETNSPGPQ